MTTDAIVNAMSVVTQVRDAVGRRPFEHAVGEFTQWLGRVPDAGPCELSARDIGLLQTLGEEVIERIETRVSRAAVCGPREQMLISRLYEIRRLLEEIHQWRRHYATWRPS
jgi:hypothetical protein